MTSMNIHLMNIDISSTSSYSGIPGPLGKTASKWQGPRCKVITAVLDPRSIQGTWLILPGAPAPKVKRDLLGIICSFANPSQYLESALQR